MNHARFRPSGWHRNPFHVLTRFAYKHTVGRWRYARGEDYAAERYWHDRFRRYGSSLRGPGWETMTERANADSYAERAEGLRDLLAIHGIELPGRRVLEVGCGTGFWIPVLRDLAPDMDYVGLDVTDVQFDELRRRFPSCDFVHADITEALPDLGTFDVILMVDVIEHIVTEDRFEAAASNIRALLRPGGVYLVSGIAPRERRPFFYLRWWSLDRLREAYPGYEVGQARPLGNERNLIVPIFAPQAEEACDGGHAPTGAASARASRDG